MRDKLDCDYFTDECEYRKCDTCPSFKREICTEYDLTKIIQEQREELVKLRYDNAVMSGKLTIIKTVMGADE